MTKLLSILFATAFGLTAMLPAQATDMGMASTAKSSEPPRFSRRPFCVSQTSMACSLRLR